MENSKSFIAMFPGQGSQKAGMGQALVQGSETARELFSRADKVLGFSLSKLCFEGPADRLNLTEITQPAILTVSVVCFKLFQERAAASGFGCEPAAAAGHSLGEYSALVAAGALPFEEAVMLVHKRGKYMQEAVPAGKGKMVAVMGKEAAELQEAIAKVTSGIVQIANLNAPGQIVIAGEKAAVDEMISHLPGAKVIELQVSAPFHCPLMKPAEERLVPDLAATSFSRARFPVYSNYFARPLSAPEEIREALKLQVCGQVRWIECMQNAITDTQASLAVEFGAGAALSGMLKRINPAVARGNADSLESIAKITG